MSETPAPASAVRLEDLGGPVVSIEVAGLAADGQAAARARLRSTVGAAYDPDTVAADVQALWALGGIADVAVDGRPAAGGVALRYQVRASDRIRKIEVRGGAAVMAGPWRDLAARYEGKPLEGPTLAELRQSMIEELHSFGYLNATVDGRVDAASAGHVDVIVTITEGLPVVLSALELRGISKVSRPALLAILNGRGGVVVGERYRRDALDAGLLHVTEHYYDTGHAQCDVGAPQETLSADRTSISVVVPIREGDVFRVGTLAVRGALLAPKSEYLRLLGVRKGQVFARGEVLKDREKLEEFQRQHGQPKPEITVLTEINAAKKTLDLTWEIEPAP